MTTSALLGVLALSLLIGAAALASWLHFRRKTIQKLVSAIDALASGDETAVSQLAVVGTSPHLAEGIRRLCTQTQARAKLQAQRANFDPVSGLPSRLFALEQLERALQTEQPVCVVALRIANFERLDRLLGTAASYALINDASEQLTSLLQDDATIALLDATTFIVVAANCPAAKVTGQMAAAQTVIAAHRIVTGIDVQLATYCGIAVSPDHGDTPLGLLKCAKSALSEAEHSGDSIAHFQTEWHSRQQTCYALMCDLQKAPANGELELHYQPQMDLTNGQTVGVEALLRWRHPTLGYVPPENFIESAEHSGAIRTVTDWVIDTALQQSRGWREQGLHIGIGVNLSATDLNDPALPESIEAALARHQVASRQLTLEISAAALTDEPERILTQLSRLRRCGVRLALDNFGSASSSLLHVTQMPFNEIKIDRSLIRAMDLHQDDVTLVQTIIDLGRRLNRRVIAKGVENQASLSILRNLDCDIAQGYFVSRPLAPSQLEAWLEAPAINMQMPPALVSG